MNFADNVIDENILTEIRDVNMSVFGLVQKLLRTNFSEGLYRTGLTEDAGQALLNLKQEQIACMASSTSLLANLRITNATAINRITQDDKNGPLRQVLTTLELAKISAATQKFGSSGHEYN